MGPVKVTPMKLRSGPKEQSPASPLLWLWSGGGWLPVLLRRGGRARGGSCADAGHIRAQAGRAHALHVHQVPVASTGTCTVTAAITAASCVPSQAPPQAWAHLRIFQYVVNAPALGPEVPGPPL